MRPHVTLHVRVWIEIVVWAGCAASGCVTLHVRVWIEMRTVDITNKKQLSHPPREGVD